jgi:hypothetical protein
MDHNALIGMKLFGAHDVDHVLANYQGLKVEFFENVIVVDFVSY